MCGTFYQFHAMWSCTCSQFNTHCKFFLSLLFYFFVMFWWIDACSFLQMTIGITKLSFKEKNSLGILVRVVLSLWIDMWRTAYSFQYWTFPSIDILSYFKFSFNRVLFCLYRISVALRTHQEDGSRGQRCQRGRERLDTPVTNYPHLWPHTLSSSPQLGSL